MKNQIPSPTANEFSYAMHNTEYEIPHHTYQDEQRIMELVKNGDTEQLRFCLQSIQSYHPGTMALSSNKQLEYMAVLGISLAVRAAMDGGMAPAKAYNLNDLYLQKIAEIHDASQYMPMAIKAFLDIAEQMQEVNKAHSGMIYVRQTKQFIHKHLNKAFTEQELAKEVGLTPTYLSALFSREEKMSISQYTRQERMRAAQNLLKYSDYSIEKIAYYLCFSSQSHFTKVFKTYTGTTPNQYRLHHTRE